MVRRPHDPRGSGWTLTPSRWPRVRWKSIGARSRACRGSALTNGSACLPRRLRFSAVARASSTRSSPPGRGSRPAPEGDGWILGDMHLENVGAYQTDAKEVVFGLNDFDEATVAPLRHDVLRFSTSVLLAARAFEATGARAIRARGEPEDVVKRRDRGLVEVVEPEDDFLGIRLVGTHVLEVHVAGDPPVAFGAGRELRPGGEDLEECVLPRRKAGVRYRWRRATASFFSRYRPDARRSSGTSRVAQTSGISPLNPSARPDR